MVPAVLCQGTWPTYSQTDKAEDLTGKTEAASSLPGSQGAIQSRDLEDFHKVLTYAAGMQQAQGKTDTLCSQAWHWLWASKLSLRELRGVPTH